MFRFIHAFIYGAETPDIGRLLCLFPNVVIISTFYPSLLVNIKIPHPKSFSKLEKDFKTFKFSHFQSL